MGMFIVVIAVVFVAITAVSVYNRLVRLRMLTREALSGVDVQLKRRHDLIPNIVETVKGYAGHERKLLEEVTAMRSGPMSAGGVKEKAAAENMLSRTLKSIFALAEAYPDLKANQNFLGLQKTLSETEDQIQLARRYYNGTVRDYNVLTETFPSSLVANMFKFERTEFFEIEYATERVAPDVNFKS